jgi:hypothetical protein
MAVGFRVLKRKRKADAARTFQVIGKGDNNRTQYEKTLRGLGCEFEP